jgi:hypothetical protein
MYATAEVRWFYRGPLPAAVRDWFEARSSRMVYQAPRRDHYLGLPGDSLSVKLREGRVEIKLRPRAGEFLRLHPQVTGVLEYWQKWSFSLADPSTTLPGIAAIDSSWLAIDKQRGVARYRIAGNGPPVAVAADVYPVQGCEVELVELVAGRQAWWSLCFEAFGQGRGLPEALVATARHFLGSAEPPGLEAGDSYGYPGWLSILVPANQ